MLMATLLFGQVVCQIYAEVTPRTMTFEKTFSDELMISGMKIRRVVQCKRTDTFNLVGGWYTELTINGTVIFNGKEYNFSFSAPKYPLAKIYETPTFEYNENARTNNYDTLGLDIPHYKWDNLNYLKSPGSGSWHVEYDHLNNIDSSGSSGTYYDAPPNAGTPKVYHGSSKYHLQVTKWQLEDIKQNLNIWELITGGAGILAAALGLVLTVFGVIMVGILLAALALLGIVVTFFIENIMETEIGDGWYWVFNIKEHFFWFIRYRVSWSMCVGEWRDWVWNLSIVLLGIRHHGGGGSLYRCI